jgi:hypothetical protein
MKKCSKCGEEKNLECFNKRKDTIDGRRNECKECWKIKSKIQYEKNKEKYNKKSKERYEINKDIILEKAKEYRKNHKIQYAEYRKNHRKERRDYNKLKRQNDNLFNLTYKIRNLIYKSIKKRGYLKSSKTNQILGIPYEDCLKYLFENAKLRYTDFKEEDFLIKDKFHIHHKVFLETAKTEEDIIELNHYTNLELLTKNDHKAIHSDINTKERM